MIMMFTFDPLHQFGGNKGRESLDMPESSTGGYLGPLDAKKPWSDTTEDDRGTMPDTSTVLLIMESEDNQAHSSSDIPLILICLPKLLSSSNVPKTINHIGNIGSQDTDRENLTPNLQQQIFDDGKYTYHAAVSDDWEGGKFGNIRTAEKVFRTRPNEDWYLFTDTHSCVIYSTLIKWLVLLDPTLPHYVGQPGIFPFAQTQSGYLVSRLAMQVMFSEPSLSLDLYRRRIAELEVNLSSKTLSEKILPSFIHQTGVLC